MFTQSREETRQFFRSAWSRHLAGTPLHAIERMVADVILAHPEYHAAVTADHFDATVVDPADNPFLHMGLHIALREQLQADRPLGVRAAFQALQTRYPDAHTREHAIMELLARVLWEAQSTGAMPDEQIYLQRVRQLSG